MSEKDLRTDSLGERLYRLREQHDLSQEELAEKLNVSRQTISNWENDKVKLDVVKAAEICRLYGIGADELIFDEDRAEKTVTPQKKNNTRLIITLVALSAAIALLIAGIVFFALPDGGEISSVMPITKLAGWCFSAIGGAAIVAVIIVLIIKGKKK